MAYSYIKNDVFAYRYFGSPPREITLKKTNDGWLIHTDAIRDSYHNKHEITNEGLISYEAYYSYDDIKESNHLVPAWELMENDEEREIFAKGSFYLMYNIGMDHIRQAKSEKSWLTSLRSLWRIVELDNIPHTHLYTYLPEVYSVWKVLYDKGLIEYNHNLYQRLKDLTVTEGNIENVRILSELIRTKWITKLEELQHNSVTHVNRLAHLLPDHKPEGNIIYHVSRPVLNDVRKSYEQEV